MLAWLCVWEGEDLHMAQLMPLPLTFSYSSKSRLVLPSWLVPDTVQRAVVVVVFYLLPFLCLVSLLFVLKAAFLSCPYPYHFQPICPSESPSTPAICQSNTSKAATDRKQEQVSICRRSTSCFRQSTAPFFLGRSICCQKWNMFIFF